MTVFHASVEGILVAAEGRARLQIRGRLPAEMLEQVVILVASRALLIRNPHKL